MNCKSLSRRKLTQLLCCRNPLLARLKSRLNFSRSLDSPLKVVSTRNCCLSPDKLCSKTFSPKFFTYWCKGKSLITVSEGESTSEQSVRKSVKGTPSSAVVRQVSSCRDQYLISPCNNMDTLWSRQVRRIEKFIDWVILTGCTAILSVRNGNWCLNQRACKEGW